MAFRYPLIFFFIACVGAAGLVLPAEAQPPVPPVPGIPGELFPQFPGVPPPPPGAPPGGFPPGVIPPPTGIPQDRPSVADDLEAVRDELDRLRREESDALNRIDLPEGWPDVISSSAAVPIRSVTHAADRPLRVLLTPLSVTTLQLQPDQQIVDCVVGDGVFFEVQCGDNLVYVKGLASARRTTLTVSTRSDRLYAFELFCLDDLSPDHVLRVLWPSASASPGVAAREGSASPVPLIGQREPSFGTGPVAIQFESALQIGLLEAEIVSAERELAAIAEQSAEELLRMELLREERLAEYIVQYPRRIEPRYRLTPEVQGPPLFVSQIWTDGRFTYLRSHSQESPALYEITGLNADEELLINYQLSPDGLYVIDHVVDAGYAQLHGSRGEWHVWDVPSLRIINDASLRDLPALAPDWRRTRSQRSWFVRHNRLALFIAIAAGSYTSLGFVNGAGGFCWKVVC